MASSQGRLGGTIRRRVIKGGLAAITAPFVSRLSWAATFPDRPIRLLVPFGVGGPVDIVARVMAQPLGEMLGGSAIVENKLGASGNIGASTVARADPDGYTVLVASSNFVINTVLTTNVPYDPIADFTPVVELAETPSAFAVRPQLGVKTLKEFIELAKKSNFSFSHPGFGTVSHMAGEFLKLRGGFNAVAVSHNGGGPAMQTLLTGAVQFVAAALPAIQPQVPSGSVLALGVTSKNRWPELPEIPTVIESGFPDFDMANFTAFFVPAKTPAEITERISKACLEILRRPETRSKLLTLGFEVTARPSAVLKARIQREIPFWRKVVDEAGIKPT